MSTPFKMKGMNFKSSPMKQDKKKYKKARKKWGCKVVEIGTDAAFLKHLEMLPKHYLEGEK